MLAASGEDRRDILPSEEVYDVTTASWSAAGRLQTAKRDLQAVSFLYGRVLTAGGGAKHSSALMSAHLYDRTIAACLSAGSMAVGRNGFRCP